MRAFFVLFLFFPQLTFAQDSLDGTWSAVEINEDGRSLPAGYLQGIQLTIWKNDYYMTANGTTIRMSFRVNENVNPPEIDVVPAVGTNAAISFSGIFETDGDELIVAYSGLNGDRPKSFAQSPGVRVTKWRKLERKTQSIEGPELVNSLGMSLKLILPGTFVMGPEPQEPRRLDEVARRVTLTEPFYIGSTEVTVRQFSAFMEDYDPKNELNLKGGFTTVGSGENRWFPEAHWKDPGFEQADDHPVVFVSYQTAQAFCKWLSEKEGRNYRLPTEAEWEYAASGLREATYSWGNEPNSVAGKANFADKSFVETYPNRVGHNEISDGFVHTAPVGSFQPNRYGLFDMHGNVLEWVSDWWGAPSPGSSINPTGPKNGDFRIAKGGAWGDTPEKLRIAYRFHDSPDQRFAGLGFRVVLAIE